jgi:hypothetical protein
MESSASGSSLNMFSCRVQDVYDWRLKSGAGKERAGQEGKMINRNRIVAVVVSLVALLTLGVGWFASGQNTNTPGQLSPGMESPLIRDINLVRQVENLAARVDALEATVGRLDNELNEIKGKSNNKK